MWPDQNRGTVQSRYNPCQVQVRTVLHLGILDVRVAEGWGCAFDVADTLDAR